MVTTGPETEHLFVWRSVRRIGLEHDSFLPEVCNAVERQPRDTTVCPEVTCG